MLIIDKVSQCDDLLLFADFEVWVKLVVLSPFDVIHNGSEVRGGIVEKLLLHLDREIDKEKYPD